MPWSPKFAKALRAIAHGWKPKKGSLKKISQAKAAAMAVEGVKKA